jgi:hypothetical protein
MFALADEVLVVLLEVVDVVDLVVLLGVVLVEVALLFLFAVLLASVGRSDVHQLII